MQKLIARERRLRFWYGLSRRTRRVAAVAVVMIAALFVSTVSVQAYRMHLFDTVRTAWEDSTLYTYLVGGGRDSETKFEEIMPQTVPHGYEMAEEVKGELRYSLLYENDKKEIIDWNQEKVTDTLSLVMDTEYDWEKIVKKNGRDVTIHGYSDGYKAAYYEYGNYIFTIYADNVEVSDILAMLPD